MNTVKNNSKAIGCGIGGAVATIIVFTLRQSGVEVPAEVDAALAALLCTVITWLAPANQPNETGK